MAYTLLVLSPCTVSVGDKQPSRLMTGDVITVNNFQGERLTNGPLRNNFKLLAQRGDNVEEKAAAPEEDVKAAAVKAIEDLGKLDAPTDEEAESVAHLIPLEDNAPWQQVRNYVLELETEIPIDLKMVKAVQNKFSSYQSVVKECKRILTQYTKTEAETVEE